MRRGGGAVRRGCRPVTAVLGARLRRLEAVVGTASAKETRCAGEAARARITARLDRIRDVANTDAPRPSVGEVRERLRGLGYFRSSTA